MVKGNEIVLINGLTKATFDIKTANRLSITPDVQLRGFVKTDFYANNSTQRVWITFEDSGVNFVDAWLHIENQDSHQHENLRVYFESG